MGSINRRIAVCLSIQRETLLPYLKNSESKKNWGCSLSHSMFAWQEQSPKFKPWYYSKINNKIKYYYVWYHNSGYMPFYIFEFHTAQREKPNVNYRIW
jgi:hypothetical protein